jgi:hypothetical protein
MLIDDINKCNLLYDFKGYDDNLAVGTVNGFPVLGNHRRFRFRRWVNVLGIADPASKHKIISK